MKNNKVKKAVREEFAKLGLSEITEDIGAFLYFLREKTDFRSNEDYQKLPSLWMLIPNTIDVDWRPDVKDFKLEKEIFSRVIWIISKPVPEEKKESRKAYLLNLFSNVVSRDQAKQIVTFLKFLKKKDIERIRREYFDFKNKLEKL